MSLTSPAFIALRVSMRFDHIMRSCAVAFLLFVVGWFDVVRDRMMYRSRAKVSCSFPAVFIVMFIPVAAVALVSGLGPVRA